MRRCGPLTNGVRELKLRALWNTFSRPALLAAVAVAFGTWLFVAVDLGPAYRNSRWWTLVRAPMFAFALYVYLAVAFNIARGQFSWVRIGGLVAWLLVGSLVPYTLAYGLVLLLTVVGLVLPELTYLPIHLGMFQTAIHVTWLGFVVALLCSIFLAGKSFMRRAACETTAP